MKIAVAGMGYVGFSTAVLLEQHNSVVVVDIVSEKLKRINKEGVDVMDKVYTRDLYFRD